ncbi:putative hydroxyacylglutathione hydrolase [Magnetofaba australis IT-1]|uniref:Hydroxyacylglutathione hydrolase n=2 Tax=Magnetofaba TaxID=1472292 RepID=A0A1Y2K6N2_9PROT|nr:putative hydroxyacylglutathione hydrolase [Magnetofaba australis IT-1]
MQSGLRLTHILLTHHHNDHIGGVDALRQQTGAQVIGHALDADNLPALDIAASDGQRLKIGDCEIQAMATPGHTPGHMVYLIDDLLLSGDALFSFGCGRLFGGTPEQMWRSIQTLRRLPDETQLCCAHEYTVKNLSFALSVTPNDEKLHALLQNAQRLRRDGEPTLPANLGVEKRYNPFMRCDEERFLQAANLHQTSPLDAFITLRERRNRF